MEPKRQSLSRINSVLEGPVYFGYVFSEHILRIGGVFVGLYFASRGDWKTATLAGGIPFAVGEAIDVYKRIRNPIEYP